MERKYIRHPDNFSKDDALDCLRNGTEEEKAQLGMIMGFDCPDYGFAQMICIKLMDSDSENIKTCAIIGLAHIARRFGKLDKRVVKPYLFRELENNISGKELIIDAIEQIHIYIKWDVAKNDINRLKQDMHQVI